MSLLKNIGKMRIIACCGSGGVGKTTVSAALGMHGAMSGRKTLVLTIDPARRLADSLGIGEFDTEAQKVPAEKFKELGLRPSGELFAMMLDTKRTFDRLIEKYSASDRMRETILGNRYYQHLSGTLSGSHEYMAMEKLYEIHQEGKYDLIVLDTPPSRNAFEFLEAPERLSKLLDNNLFRKILKPAGLIYLSVKQGNEEKFVEKDEYKGRTKFFAFYTQDEFKNLIESCNFKIVKVLIDNKKDTWINVFATKE